MHTVCTSLRPFSWLWRKDLGSPNPPCRCHIWVHHVAMRLPLVSPHEVRGAKLSPRVLEATTAPGAGGHQPGGGETAARSTGRGDLPTGPGTTTSGEGTVLSGFLPLTKAQSLPREGHRGLPSFGVPPPLTDSPGPAPSTVSARLGRRAAPVSHWGTHESHSHSP